MADESHDAFVVRWKEDLFREAVDEARRQYEIQRSPEARAKYRRVLAEFTDLVFGRTAHASDL